VLTADPGDTLRPDECGMTTEAVVELATARLLAPIHAETT
jgi:hypothetical protein